MARTGLYVPLDVNFSDDDKMLVTCAEAQIVYLRSLALVKRLGTGGFVHRNHLRTIGNGFAYADIEPEVLAAELERNGLWEAAEDGWQIPSWEMHNPSSPEQEERRKKDADRKKAWRDRKRDASRVADATSRPEPSQPDVTPATRSNSKSDSEGKSELATRRDASRDELFDAVVTVCGINPGELTPSARGPLNGAIAQLRGVKATPLQVRERGALWPSRYPSITLTPSALAKHWPQLDPSRSTNGAALALPKGAGALARAAQRGGQ